MAQLDSPSIETITLPALSTSNSVVALSTRSPDGHLSKSYLVADEFIPPLPLSTHNGHVGIGTMHVPILVADKGAAALFPECLQQTAYKEELGKTLYTVQLVEHRKQISSRFLRRLDNSMDHYSLILFLTNTNIYLHFEQLETYPAPLRSLVKPVLWKTIPCFHSSYNKSPFYKLRFYFRKLQSTF